MAPDVRTRKLAFLRRLLDDLERHRHADRAAVEAAHYEIERILELLATAAADLLFHLLAERDVHPGTYRDAFAEAGKTGLLPPDLARRLEAAAGQRNLLVHLDEGIDYEVLRASVPRALEDYAAFLVELR